MKGCYLITMQFRVDKFAISLEGRERIFFHVVETKRSLEFNELVKFSLIIHFSRCKFRRRVRYFPPFFFPFSNFKMNEGKKKGRGQQGNSIFHETGFIVNGYTLYTSPGKLFSSTFGFARDGDFILIFRLIYLFPSRCYAILNSLKDFHDRGYAIFNLIKNWFTQWRNESTSTEY